MKIERKELGIVQEQFGLVRKKFFPKWDRKREWSIKFFIDPALGRCDRKSKTIFVSRWHGFLHFDIKRLISYIRSMCVELTPRQALWFLLIHEVCHAVNNPFEGHGKRFQQRILKAGEKAAEIGHLRLSKALRKEAELTKYVWIDEKREKRLISVLRKSMFKRVKPAKLELTGSRPNCKTR